jgi:CheY-like chemotaxis protein
VSLRVRDQGIGLAEADLTSIFDKFSQVDGAATRRAGGTGLGLAISRTLARLMGGDITVESRPGEGSCFSLDLPLSRAEGHGPASAPPAAAGGPSARSLRILAAEDNDTNQLVLRALLEPLQVELVVVANGAQALDAWASEPFDLILMDIQMPVMDGVDAAAAIRAREARAGRPSVPILALTANAMDHQRRAYEAAGFSGVVAKPIDAAALFAAISAAIEDPTTDARAEHAA